MHKLEQTPDERLSRDVQEFTKTVMQDNLYSQFNIIRYNSLDTIKREDLGQHHAVVAQLTAKIIELLVDKYKLNIDDHTKYLAMLAAAYHDMGEVIYGDQNYEVKRDNPDLAVISNRVEHDYIASLGYIGPLFTEAMQNELAHAIYKLADSIELLMFVRRERKLGNSDNYLDTIVHNGYTLAAKWLGVIRDWEGRNAD